MDALGREVDRMYGKYSKFSPGLKGAIAHETPFIAWYLNAVKFIYHTMPKNHPIATSVINNADVATREWRKDKGLGLFLDQHVPAFLQGSVPTSTGNLRFRYTPFSVMGDPLGGLAGIIFPQFKSVIMNLAGLDWKGDPLPGYDQNSIAVGGAEALKSLTAALVPAYTIANKALNAKEGESTSRHIRRTIGDPFMESQSPQQRKAGSAAPADPYKRSSSRGGATKDKYKRSKSTSSGNDKYKRGGG
jgi:hypothetical protein